jgi:hypothetical protein
LTLEAPINLDKAERNAGTVTLLVNGTVRRAVDVRQRDPDGRYYDGRIDLASLDLDAGDEITLRYGSGVFDVEEVVIAA